MVYDCSVTCILLLSSTSQTLEQTDKLQKLLFQFQDHLCWMLGNESDVYAMGPKSSGPLTA